MYWLEALIGASAIFLIVCWALCRRSYLTKKSNWKWYKRGYKRRVHPEDREDWKV